MESIKQCGQLDPKKYVTIDEWEGHVSSIRGDKRKRKDDDDDENKEEERSKKTKASEEEESGKDIDFYIKRYNQQSGIIKDNEELIQTQANEIEKKENKMQKIENNYERELIKFQKEVIGYEKIIDAKNKKIKELEEELEILKKTKGTDSQTPTSVQSCSTGESQNISARKEGESSKSNVEENVLKGKGSQTIYIQKTMIGQTSDTSEIILVEKEEEKSTCKRSGKTMPVPESLRRTDEIRYYCDKCSSHFKRKDSLENHKKHHCLQQLRRHICVECTKGFYSETSVREHYYKDHLKKFLYFCKKCNEGFAHNSRKSTHIKSGKCANLKEPDQFPGRAELDEVLEKTFKRRELAVPVQVSNIQNPDESEPNTSTNREQQEHEGEKDDNQSEIRKDKMLSESSDPSTIDMGSMRMVDDSVVTTDLGLPSVGQSEVTGDASSILLQMSVGGGSLLDVKDEGIDLEGKENQELHLELEDDDDDLL